MNPQAKAELNGVIQDITVIIKELNNISVELKQFKGIGAEYCSKKLGQISNDYTNIRSKLYQL